MKKQKLNFEYCECGCKGYSAGAGINSFWIYWDLNKKYTLFEGHGWYGNKVDNFPSLEKAEEKATKLFIANLKEQNKYLIDKS